MAKAKGKATGAGWPSEAKPDDEPQNLTAAEPAAAPDAEQEQPADAPLLAPGRPLFLIFAFGLVLMAVTARLIHWTAFPSISQAADAPPALKEPMRGRIVDRNGMLLATDGFYGSVYAKPSSKFLEADAHNHQGTQVALSTTLALEWQPEQISAALAVTTPIAVLTRSATVAQCDGINAIDAPQLVWCDMERSRKYPQHSLAAHVLGFLDYQHHGLYGVEARYDTWLNADEHWQGNLPAEAEALPDSWRVYLPSPAGRDLVLNLDLPLQYMVEKRLQEAITRYQAESGTIIVMNPRTGAILAMANNPTFDPSQFSDVSENTWVNTAISSIYEPGSVFKLVTMSAGIDSGFITPESPFVDPGELKVGGRLVQNAERRAYGAVTVREALARSINVVSAKISLLMGPDIFYGYVRQFGFNRPTEVDLQSEVRGIVKQPGRGTDWSQYDQAANSFGQGISVTALQMINAVAAIANDGVMLQPQVVGALVENGQMYRIPPRILGSPIRQDTAKAVTRMMVYTVESYSAPDPVPGFLVAGKTGTAEIPTREGYTSDLGIHSFIGFLPAANPQLIIMVKLVKPKVGKWAEQVAVPTFAEVGKDAVQILELKPDKSRP